MRRILTLLIRRFRWVVLGAVVRSATQRSRDRSVEAATAELADRLPDPVVKAMDAAPGDLLRAGGSAMAAGRAARRAGQTTKRFGSTIHRLRAPGHRPDLAGTARSMRRQWEAEAGRAERELWADYHRHQGDVTAADELLLDRRDRLERAQAPLPRIPDPTPSGRPRRLRPRTALVDRVQRTYRRASKPWDH